MVVFCAVLAVQVAVPLTRVWSDEMTRFGWQMFASVRHHPTYLVRYAGGGLDTVRVEEHVVLARPEIELHQVLPPHLCRSVEGAEAVRMEWPAVASRVPDVVEFPCR